MFHQTRLNIWKINRIFIIGRQNWLPTRFNEKHTHVTFLMSEPINVSRIPSRKKKLSNLLNQWAKVKQPLPRSLNSDHHDSRVGLIRPISIAKCSIARRLVMHSQTCHRRTRRLASRIFYSTDQRQKATPLEAIYRAITRNWWCVLCRRSTGLCQPPREPV